MNKQQLIIGFFIFLLGLLTDALLLSRLKAKPEVTNALSAAVEPNSRGLNRLVSLTENDIAEYYRLKSMEERYKKADEILGKIVALIIADLGLRVSPEIVEAAKQPLLLESSSPTVSTNQEVTALPSPVTEKKSVNWVDFEKSLDQVQSPKDISKFLEDTKIKDLDQEFKKSLSYTNRSGTFQVLNGAFGGLANVITYKKQKQWTVEMFIAAKIEDRGLQGKANLILFNDGRAFSRQRGNGVLQEIREVPGSRAILIEASPTIEFQLYYFSYNDSFAGNVYMRESSASDFKHIGTVELSRLN